MNKQLQDQRRRFLKQMALLGGTSILASQSKLQLISTALAADYGGISDYKSLVCIFLFGGNDAFNMFIPNGSAEYQNYANIRQNMAIAQNTLLPINNDQHGFHPSMPKIRDLYRTNKLALISNLGNLIEPVTRQQYLDYENGMGSIRLPRGLFSHSDQQEIWQTNLMPEAGTSHSGWGGRMADLLRDVNRFPFSFTLNGNNAWQASDRIDTSQFSLSSGGISNFFFLTESPDGWPEKRPDLSSAWEAVFNLNNTHALKQQANDAHLRTKANINELQSALAQTPNIQTTFDDQNELASQLRMAAKLISVREILGMKRQIFFVGLGGWDTHGNQLEDHTALLAQLDHAMDSFYQTTEELGMTDSVTAFTASEFGRTLTSNGDGTDHAWGTHSLVMGGNVDGGKIHGELPILEIGGSDDAGDDGRIIPKYSVDQYGATLAKWMGVNDSDRLSIFPNLGNFTLQDLGFMKS